MSDAPTGTSARTMCLVNLFLLDPPQNGGVSRTAREISRMLLESASTGQLQVRFVVGSRFADRFAGWLGEATAPVITCFGEAHAQSIIRTVQADVIVSPLFGPFPFVPAEGPAASRHIAWMPDALALDRPELFSSRDLEFRKEVYRSLRGVSRTITPSEHSRERLIAHLGLSRERIGVVPHGVPEALGGCDGDIPLPDPFVLYPANDWRHKRHDLLVEIMKEIWKERPRLKLVLTGHHRPDLAAELGARHEIPQDKILDLGSVSDGTLGALYRHADALLFVSEYEGFGRPVLEAMWNGCPVLCAPVTSMPEVAGDAALYVRSDDPRDWARTYLQDLPAQRKDLTTRARAHAATFNWERRRGLLHAQLEAVGVKLAQ